MTLSESIVFDLGGYHGEFAEKIYNKYQCSIYVFEPVKEHFNIIRSKFSGNSIKMREDIHLELNKTHHTTYNYYFVWENWELDR
jgi:hypothetical protein